jgi:hypothetical protein
MGRAMVILVLGLMVSLGYTFIGMTEQRKLLSEQSATNASQALAGNLSKTGIQFALEEFNQDSTWRGPRTLNFDEGDVTISINETQPSKIIKVTSDAKVQNDNKKTIATFDISNKEQLVPEFKSSLGITTDDFNFFLGGSSNINGYDQTGQCSDSPGVTVNSQSGKDIVGDNSRIDGTPEDEAAIDNTPYEPYARLVDRLAGNPQTKRISGNYKGDMGTEDDPGIFFVEDRTKLTGGISEGYGIMVVRAGGELELEGDLDIAGNFQFNGIVIFENAWQMDAKGTPTINGSVIVGNTDDSSVDIDINGNVQLQYDCTAKKYADLAAESALNRDRIFEQKSYYVGN